MSAVAVAHHAGSMFDDSKTLTLSGTVKSLELQNPHSYMWVFVGGGSDVWTVELPAPAMLARSGWKRNSAKPGDKISVDVHPLRDGSNGGILVRMVFADGHEFASGRGGAGRGGAGGNADPDRRSGAP